MCRWDLLRPVCALASLVSKWDTECDKKLHKLMCYIDSTMNMRLIGKVGDKVEQGDTVMIIEAMKVMNPILAHRSGVVTEILVKASEPVEFNQELLIIE